MLIDIDLDYSNRAVTGPGTREPLSQLDFKRDTASEIRVRFWQGGIRVELAADAVGKFAIKPKGKYDAASLVFAEEWVKTGTGADTVYTFTPEFNGEALADLLYSGDGNPNNDLDDVAAMTEIRWIIDGKKSRTQTIPTIIANDVIKDSDTSPTPLPTPIGDTAPVGVTNASLTVNPDGENNTFIVTAMVPGSAGNNIGFGLGEASYGAAIAYTENIDLSIFATPASRQYMTISAPSDPSVDGQELKYMGLNATFGEVWATTGVIDPLGTGPSGDGIWLYTDGSAAAVLSLLVSDTTVAQWADFTPGTWPNGDLFQPYTGSSVADLTLTAGATKAQDMIDYINGFATLITAAPVGLATGALNLEVPAALLTEGTDTAAPPWIRVAGGYLYVLGAGVWQKAALTPAL